MRGSSQHKIAHVSKTVEDINLDYNIKLPISRKSLEISKNGGNFWVF